MTPDEANIISDIFARIRQMGPPPRDPEAQEAVERELRSNPGAAIGLLRAIVALDHERAALAEENQALRDELARLQEPEPPRAGGLFGDLFGGRGSVPPAAPQPSQPSRTGSPWGSPPWGSSQPDPVPQPQSSGPWGSRSEPMPAPAPVPPPAAQGGGVLQTALGAATGLAGGYLAYEAMKGLFGGADKGGSGLFGSAHASERSDTSKADSGSDDFETGGGLDDWFGGGDSEGS